MTDASITGTRTARELCIERFKEWWTLEEIAGILSKLNPNIVYLMKEHGEEVSNPDRMAEILYDTVGPRFLRNIDNNTLKRKEFLSLVFETLICKGMIQWEKIVQAAREARPSKRGSINGVVDALELDATAKWCTLLAELLGLPEDVAEKEHLDAPPDTEVVEPHVRLDPLYDYQYSTGLFVRGILEGEIMENDMEIKRKLIAVPTGSGKTRMMVEVLVEWLNDGKPSKNAKQRDSKFILWIAQSRELCEQTFGTFRSVFESIGRRGTTLRLHRFWGTGGELPSMEASDLLDEKGVIVATIQSLNKLIDEPKKIEELGRHTACIVIDEAHHTIAESYSNVLGRMGFNWNNRKKEVSEWGTILLGLTATPFRGKGNNEESRRLLRRYGGVHVPTVTYTDEPNTDNIHALIDCQPVGLAGEYVKVLGEKSYDMDGYITDYSWTIRREDGECAQEPRYVKINEGKNVRVIFPEPGRYAISLSITDNKGNTDAASRGIVIGTKPSGPAASPDMQKELYHKLIKRKILCDVQHRIIESGRIELNSQEEKHIRQFGEFGKSTLKSIGNNHIRNKVILDVIHQTRRAGRKKILFFGCSVEHSRQISMLLRILYNMKTRYVDSKMDLDARVSAIENFRSGGLEVLCNFDVLTTGFDSPNIDCVFVGRPVKSTLLYTQMIGRGMRGKNSGGTKDVLLIDIDDNFQLQNRYGDRSVTLLGWKVFREYWRPWSDADENPAVPVEPEEPEEVQDITLTCAKCGAVAEGIESVRDIFGIEGPAGLLADCIRSGDGSVPSECKNCRW